MLNNENLKNLTEIERTVLEKRYEEQKTLREIGEELNLTEARVAVIHTRTVIKLRHA